MKKIKIIDDNSVLKKFNIYINNKKQSKKTLQYSLSDNDELFITERNIALNPLWHLYKFMMALLATLSGDIEVFTQQETERFATQKTLSIKYDLLKNEQNILVIEKDYVGRLNNDAYFPFELKVNEIAFKRFSSFNKHVKIFAAIFLGTWLLVVALIIIISIIISKT